MTCPHRFDVGVYVLGALEPAEREGFESHLPGCADCRRSLGEVAGLPGLLARVPDPERAAHPEPPDLLDGVLHRVRRRRRTGWALAAVAVVVALLGGGAIGWTVPPDATAPAVREVALPPVGASETSGLAGLTAKPWGTAISLSCLYHGAERPPAAPDAARTTYVLVVRGPDGREEQVARWSPPPGQDVVVAAATDLTPDRVRGLEVRTADGATVMRS
ncbi:zf-HC2 domain-containing protein [Actinomycetospora chlora]|uniref:Zf-HC2 domain-containing protein n=1 Tax=Actinomycetospora chlora TaxID=663608 RepID=A0ABP9AEP6_9PSEU